MRIIRDYRGLAPSERGASAAIGNFDGVHKGHQVLLKDAARARSDPNVPIGVITFEPHPRRFFQPDAPPFRLSTEEERARRLESLGVDLVYQLGFDAALSAMMPETFVRDVLVEGLGITHLVLGADFRFGKARAGDAVLLRTMGTELGFGVTIHELIGDETGEYASTALRVMVSDGRCAEAAGQMGWWHTVSGRVQLGDQRGRELGYPTANLDFGEQIVPRFGVYAAWVEVLDGPHKGRYAGVASIGERPTFGVNAPNFEVHLFDFDGDLYGADISVGLIQYLRAEEKFEDVMSLINQMNLDSLAARAVLDSAYLPPAEA